MPFSTGNAKGPNGVSNRYHYASWCGAGGYEIQNGGRDHAEPHPNARWTQPPKREEDIPTKAGAGDASKGGGTRPRLPTYRALLCQSIAMLAHRYGKGNKGDSQPSPQGPRSQTLGVGYPSGALPKFRCEAQNLARAVVNARDTAGGHPPGTGPKGAKKGRESRLEDLRPGPSRFETNRALGPGLARVPGPPSPLNLTKPRL